MLLGLQSKALPAKHSLLPLHKDRQSKALQLLDFVSFFLRKKEDFVEGKESEEKNIAYNWVLSLVA